jgi:hypothetical protein
MVVTKCHLLRCPVEDGAPVDKLPFILRHRFGSGLWGKNAIVAISL